MHACTVKIYWPRNIHNKVYNVIYSFKERAWSTGITNFCHLKVSLYFIEKQEFGFEQNIFFYNIKYTLENEYLQLPDIYFFHITANNQKSNHKK